MSKKLIDIHIPEEFEKLGITKVIVTYLHKEKGIKKFIAKTLFKKHMKNEFTIYTWCIVRDSIIEMQKKGICDIEFVK